MPVPAVQLISGGNLLMGSIATKRKGGARKIDQAKELQQRE
jgi:hypothetical protein